MKNYETIVVGLGAIGSAALYHLAKNGQRVLGIDQFDPPHNLGSSHGQTRIIREAYFEGPFYVPLVQRARVLWDELQAESARPIIKKTGGLMIGPAGGTLVSGAKLSADEHGLAYEKWSADEIRHHFPAFQPKSDIVGIWEPPAGVLYPENCISELLAGASEFSAGIIKNTPVIKWEPDGEGVKVITKNETFYADKLILSAGAWMKNLCAELDLPLTVNRQVLHWFESKQTAQVKLPIFIWEHEKGRHFYGFPQDEIGLKLAVHHEGNLTTANQLDRGVNQAEITSLQKRVTPFMPDVYGRCVKSEVCMYTNTPDEHFIIDHHPKYNQVILASPCSGHGFKFATAIGEGLAEMAGGSTFPAFDPFRLSRFNI